MELHQEQSFLLSPTHLTLQPGQQSLKFSLKNTSTRSARYQLSTGDAEHFKIMNARTFQLAPGMGKVIKVEHVHTIGKCSAFPTILQVVDGNGMRQYLRLRCREDTPQEDRKVEVQTRVNLEKIRTNQERALDIPFKNVGKENLKVKIRYRMEKGLEDKLVFKLLEEQMVVLCGASKKLRASLKLLKEVQFQIEVVMEFVEQGTRDRWQQVITITGNSLIRSQFVSDLKGTRIDFLSHQLLNGTSVSGSFLLVNNYHKPCPFRLLEVIEVGDYKSYCLRLEEIGVKLETKEGIVGEKSSVRINYTLNTTPNEDDRSFTYRYSQLPAKDEVNSYKLRNSNFFKKNLQLLLKVQFGDDNPASTFKLKAHVVNPAIKVSRITQGGTGTDAFEVVNDTGLQVPFRFGTSLYYASKITKGRLRQGTNQIQIQWRKQSNSLTTKTKENMQGLLKCVVKMEIPKNEIIIYEPSVLQRPKTALIRSPSASRQNLREKICMRAPSKAGSYGVKNLREVSFEDFTQQPLKYLKGEDFDQEQLRFLQVNQNQKGNVITNSHKSKNIILFFPDRGYLYLQSQHSYILPYQRKSLRFQFSGRVFEVKTREVQDKQPYKIGTKELSFVFSPNQKEFQVVKQVQIHNRSAEFIMVYCLSVDDDYFHSLQQDHKLIIGPKSTALFKLAFFPKAEIRLKQSKIVRTLQFLINNQKEQIHCQGDLLAADVDVDQKNLDFRNCMYSPQEVIKKITVFNKGLNKVNFQINHSENIKMVPMTGLINQKSKQALTLSFIPSKLSKEHHENITLYFKGSHAVVIPLYITTLQPQIQCLQREINFKEGYLSETLTASINIVNRNAYQCKFSINFQGTELKTMKNFVISAGKTRKIEFQLLITDVGERVIKLPPDFIELQGYGALKGPTEYRYTGRKTLLQLIPDNPFNNLVFSQIQETKSFKIRNLSQEIQSIELILTPENRKECEETIILSCQPTSSDLYPGEEKEFKLLSIRGDSNFPNNQSKFFKYSLALNMKDKRKYRKLDFTLEVPAPQLEISPNDVYFPLTAVGTWSKSSFKILNKGYKEVLISIKKPVNIAFQFDFKTENQSNRLTKLNNLMQVSLFYKSKKTVSFSVNLEIEDNFGKKYLVRVHGTTSNSPLLNCQRGINSSSKGFSSKEIRSTNSPSLLSSTTLAQCSQEVENIRFINRWFSSFLSDFAKDNENFNTWLKIPRNFIQLLKYLKIDISSKEDNLDSIIEQLKKCGLPVYTVKVRELMQGNLDEWSTCLWFILSKELIHDDTLKWVNKLCGISLETYENAFSHQKKIFNDLLTKLFQPIFKGKIMDLQKILQYLEPSFPVLTKIQNKKQFMIAINILHNKFARIQKEKVVITNMEYDLKIESKSKSKKNYWILGSSSFEPTLGPNCFNYKHTSQKKLLFFNAEGDDSVNIKLKDDLSLAVWNNNLHEPFKIYELQINKKAPHIHNICIQCQNKCSQQWKLLFPCEIQSQYFFEFSGGMQFKCKMPDLGVIKSGQTMEFRIIYSPTNLKQHCGVLKISNKYEQHVYNLKGKSLRSNYVEIQRSIHIPQGQKHQQTFSVAQDADVCSEHTNYKVTILGETCEQIKSLQAKSNKKEIIVQAVMEFNRVLQEKQVFLQVFNEEMTFCKNIRLIISVIPKPIILQARLKGIIDKVTVQNIPITNALPVKQNCYVTLKKIGKQEYDNFSRYLLERQQCNNDAQSGQGEFKLSQTGKIVLKPKEKLNINLSFTPANLVQSYCQIRIKMQGTENIIIYNFLGAPQLPCTDNPPIILKCQAEQATNETIKVPNRLRERVTFDVQTNLSFIAGPEQITVNGRETFLYSFKVLPLHAGTFQGEIIFKNDKFYLVYPLKITVVSKKKIRKIRVQSKIRVTSTIQIELSNKSDKDIEYEVYCKSEYLKVDPIFLLPANSEKALILNYTPLFVGTKTAQLRLYHESMQEINYNLQMISQDHKQSLKFNCELGQKKKVKVPIKNPTSQVAQLFQPKLPKELTCHLSGNEHFPINIPAYGIVMLEFLFTQYKMQGDYKYSIELPTDSIGNFNYDLIFTNESVKKMPETIIHYLQSQKKQVIKKEFCMQLFNHFDEPLQFQIASQTMEISPSTSLFIDSALKFQLKGYEKRRIRCEVSILQEKKSNKMIPDNASGRSNQLPAKNNEIAIQSKGFKWLFPIQVVKIYEMKNVLEIVGSSQQLAKARISLKYIKGIKKWVISDCPNYKENFNLSFISSREVYLETIFNKPYQYNGFVMFYDEDMSCAQRYALNINIGEKKFEKVWITANVGEKGRVQIRLKNGKGHYKVQLKNNKTKEFGVSPMQGDFKEKGQNIIYFQYSPVEYNGNKKAQVYINSDYGSFNFYLMGKFPPLK